MKGGRRGYETVKIKRTKIAKLALGLKCKGEPLHSSLSRIALDKIKIMKKIATFEET